MNCLASLEMTIGELFLSYLASKCWFGEKSEVGLQIIILKCKNFLLILIL